MPATVRIFGFPMHPWTMQFTVDEIARRLEHGQFTQHVVVNVAKLVHMRHDLELRSAVTSCDIINIDGMGVVFGGRFLNLDIPERVAGIDLFYRLLTLASQRGERVFLLGARAEVLEQAVANLRQQYPSLQIAGYHHGYFWDDEMALVDKVRQSGASMLFVGVTSPKKEQFIERRKNQLGVKFVMGVGGTFDIVAGITRRAPVWMQRSGLEWFYRVLQEPGRMWKRYLFTNVMFLFLILREKIRPVEKRHG